MNKFIFKNYYINKYFLISFSLILLHLILIIFWPFSSYLVDVQEVYPEIIRKTEFSPAEIMQSILYLIAFMISLKNLLYKKYQRKTFFIITIVILILFGEETSWLQHYINYSIPAIQNINAQNEVNIHNLFIFQPYRFLRDGNITLDLLLKSQNLFRIFFCFYFFFLPLIMVFKPFKNSFMKYIFLKPSRGFTISLSITLLFNIIITLLYVYPSSIINPIAEFRELIYATYICLYITEL